MAAPLSHLVDRVAFITGGSSGIGLGIARACSSAGMKVAISYLTEEHLKQASTYFADCRDRFFAIKLDVGDRDAMRHAADKIERRLGNVNLLCNNAGVGLTTPILEAAYEDWDYALSVNLGGVVNGVQTFLPRMLERGEPSHIIATASMSGLFHGGSAGIYTTSKFAVVGMMEALRAELMSRTPPIGVSVFCPGLVASNIFLPNRNRPCRFGGGGPHGLDPRWQAHTKAFMAAGMDPFDCGEKVLRGVRRNDMYIITHPEYRGGLQERCDALLASVPLADPPPPEERVNAERRVLRHAVYSVEKEKLELSAP